MQVPMQVRPQRQLQARWPTPWQALWLTLIPALMLATSPAAQAEGNADDAAATLARLQAAAASLGPRGGHRPTTITSHEEGHALHAELHGLIERPFTDLSHALATPAQWCTVLLVHINNKGCAVAGGAAAPTISLRVARKYDQPVERAYELQFGYRPLAASPAMLSVELHAAGGPMGTSDYLIRLDAAPAGDNRTVVALSYAYRQNMMTALAMDLYFATIGRGKVGFTETGRLADGRPQFIGGVRGLVERNLMRYYLAMEAGATDPDSNRPGSFERRLRHWFDSTEDYPVQLREVDSERFMESKRPLMQKAP